MIDLIFYSYENNSSLLEEHGFQSVILLSTFFKTIITKKKTTHVCSYLFLLAVGKSTLKMHATICCMCHQLLLFFSQCL